MIHDVRYRLFKTRVDLLSTDCLHVAGDERLTRYIRGYLMWHRVRGIIVFGESKKRKSGKLEVLRTRVTSRHSDFLVAFIMRLASDGFHIQPVTKVDPETRDKKEHEVMQLADQLLSVCTADDDSAIEDYKRVVERLPQLSFRGLCAVHDALREEKIVN